MPIVLLTGFFTGGVLALQTYRTLSTFGEVAILGQVVSLSVVRELGPVLTSLMVAGRNSSGIASEIGSMLVSEQVDAMRALGTDPIRKLVTPRLYATIITLPLLTILADFFGMLGGFIVSYSTVHLSSVEYWTYAYQALSFQDVTQGLLKPFLFAVIIALVGCYYGLSTQGGTEGVGRSTTQAVVWASVLDSGGRFFRHQVSDRDSFLLKPHLEIGIGMVAGRGLRPCRLFYADAAVRPA